MISRSRILLALMPALILLGYSVVPACTCMGTNSPREEWAKSDDVFLGHIVSIGGMSGTLPPRGASVRVVAVVEQRWRGAVADTIELFTGLGGGDCGYPFAMNRRYLIYATRTAGTLITNICTRTRPIEQAADDIRELDVRQKGRPGIRSYAGFAAVQTDIRRFGGVVGVGLDFPLSSNLTAIADVFINPISSTPSATTKVEGMVAVAYGGVKYRVGDVMYFAGRAGLSWINIDSKTERRGAVAAVVSEETGVVPVVNFGLGFETDTEKFVRPYGEVNLVGMLDIMNIRPRWIAAITIGANFDL